MGEFGSSSDHIGNFPSPNPLSLTKVTWQFPRLVGTQYTDPPTSRPIRQFTNYPIDYQPGAPGIPSASGIRRLNTLDVNNFAWKVMSEANPSAPITSVPTFIAELKDLPSLMKNWYGLFLRGKSAFRPSQANWRPPKGAPRQPPSSWNKMLQLIPETIASGHLTWRWAIAPFIDDIRKFCDASFHISRNLAMLQRLQDGKALRRRVSLRTTTYSEVQSNVFLHSDGTIIKGDLLTSCSEKSWGTVTYSLPKSTDLGTSPGSLAEANRQLNRMRRLTYGITTYGLLETAWELMPWSWMVDWFTNLGSVISANNNSLGLQRGSICLMQTINTNRTIQAITQKADWVTLVGSDFYQAYVTKDRIVNAVPLLPFAPTYLPLLTWKAQSILGSLAVLRARPGNSQSSYLYRKT